MRVQPGAAGFNAEMGEFLMPYEAVRASADPDATLLSFLQSTYEAAANLAHWDRAFLEGPTGPIGRRPASDRHRMRWNQASERPAAVSINSAASAAKKAVISISRVSTTS